MRTLAHALAFSVMVVAVASADESPEGACLNDEMCKKSDGNEDEGDLLAMMEMSMLQAGVKVTEQKTALHQHDHHASLSKNTKNQESQRKATPHTQLPPMRQTKLVQARSKLSTSHQTRHAQVRPNSAMPLHMRLHAKPEAPMHRVEKNVNLGTPLRKRILPQRLDMRPDNQVSLMEDISVLKHELREETTLYSQGKGRGRRTIDGRPQTPNATDAQRLEYMIEQALVQPFHYGIMKDHIDVQYEIMLDIQGLLLLDDNRTLGPAAIEAGLVPAVMRTLMGEPDSIASQATSCRVMFTLLLRFPEYAKNFREAGAYNYIMDAMDRFQDGDDTPVHLGVTMGMNYNVTASCFFPASMIYLDDLKRQYPDETIMSWKPWLDVKV